jgi:hypothetical protein
VVFVFFRVWCWRSREQASQIVVVVVARLLAGVVARLLLVLLLRGFGCWCCIANAVWLEFFGRGWIGIFLSGHQEEEEEESLQVWMQVFRRPSALYRSNCSSDLNIGQAMGSKKLLLLSQICQV